MFNNDKLTITSTSRKTTTKTKNNNTGLYNNIEDKSRKDDIFQQKCSYTHFTPNQKIIETQCSTGERSVIFGAHDREWYGLKTKS